jgi:hypothetical protein
MRGLMFIKEYLASGFQQQTKANPTNLLSAELLLMPIMRSKELTANQKANAAKSFVSYCAKS